MIITKEVPCSWKDLQDKVCKYLNQAGYHAVSPKTIETVRGNVEVDVFVTSEDELLKQFVCECKYWDTPVTKEKIHAFRTVVQDSGSMLDVFISKNGFQKGAIEAANCSNVILKDWNGFLDLIEHQWLKHRSEKVLKLSLPLSVYTDPLDVPAEIFRDEVTKAKYRELELKYVPSYMMIRSLEMGMQNPDEPVILDNVKYDDYNNLFNYIERMLILAVEEYESLFSVHKVEQWKLDCADRTRFVPRFDEYLTK